MQGTEHSFELALELRLLVAFQITRSIPTAKTNAFKVNATAKRKSRFLSFFFSLFRTVTSLKSETVGCVKNRVVYAEEGLGVWTK